jgi:hypothetical protein
MGRSEDSHRWLNPSVEGFITCKRTRTHKVRVFLWEGLHHEERSQRVLQACNILWRVVHLYRYPHELPPVPVNDGNFDAVLMEEFIL